MDSDRYRVARYEIVLGPIDSRRCVFTTRRPEIGQIVRVRDGRWIVETRDRRQPYRYLARRLVAGEGSQTRSDGCR